MVSQQLYGEGCLVVDTARDHWIKVKCSYDGYEGWCQEGHVKLITDDAYNINNYELTAAFATGIETEDGIMQVPMGSNIYLLPVQVKDKIKESLWQGEAIIGSREKVIRRVTSQFLNTPYLWGGKSTFGIDCSGFTQTVFKFLDTPLLRDAYQQADQGEQVDRLSDVQCGDLAFFDNSEGRITHVGILYDQTRIIHSSVKVRVDTIDNEGIINNETSERTHKLKLIKRYLSPDL
jgi:hypothetical protein